jgi:hypothetical protein
VKRLPKTHKEEIGIRQLVNGRGSVLEELKEEMAKVFKVVEIRQKKKKLRNSEELVEEWKNMCLEEEEIMFSVDVEKNVYKIKK